MKKFLGILLCICFLPGLVLAKEEDTLAIYIRGQNLEDLQVARAVQEGKKVEEIKEIQNSYYLVKENRTFLPLRSIGEELGFKVEWKQEEKEILVIKGKDKVRMTLGSKIYWKNNEKKEMDVVPFVRNERTYLPIRFLGEALDEKVEWDQETKLVTIGAYQDLTGKEKDGQIVTEELQRKGQGKVSYSYVLFDAYKKDILQGKEREVPSFYDRKTKENSLEFPGWIGGFYLEKNPKQIPVPHLLLGKVPGGYLCFNFASDVQTDINKEALVKSYEKSREEVCEILTTVKINK